MKATVNTKSNYKNCNGQELDVVEISGTRVSCQVPRFGFNKSGESVGEFGTSDFQLSEITNFSSHKFN